MELRQASARTRLRSVEIPVPRIRALSFLAASFRPPSLIILPVLFALLLLAGSYLSLGQEVTLVVDRHLIRVRTRQKSVRGLVGELGIALAAEDRVEPGLDSPLGSTARVVIDRAQPVVIAVDGETRTLNSQAESLAQVLRQANVSLRSRDRVLVGGVVVSPDTPLAQLGPSSRLGEKAPLNLQVQRAIWLRVNDDGAQSTISTFAATVGRAFYEAGIPVFLADRVYPPSDAPVQSGMEICIQRSKPVTIFADGKLVKTRTHSGWVSQLLAEQGIALQRKDYSLPDSDSPVTDGLGVQVIRRSEEVYTKTEPIPFSRLLRASSDLELDQVRLAQAGKEGVRKQQYRIIYEDGQEVERRLEREWADPEPLDQITAYGTKIVIRELDTPLGKVRYWRRLRVLITSYNEATCDKPRDHPAFAITKLGWRVFEGVIAVDPTVIPMESKMYVPGYGLGVAADTGGKIKGLHIDLYFPEDKMQLWYKWEDIYLLEPPPPRDNIRWILASYPRPRGG